MYSYPSLFRDNTVLCKDTKNEEIFERFILLTLVITAIACVKPKKRMAAFCAAILFFGNSLGNGYRMIFV